MNSVRLIILRRIQCVYFLYFCWSDLLYILRFAACSFAVLCSLNVHLLLWLKSVEALRLTIFHPRGLTDSALWIRVQPSDFPRLVHHCKRMKSYLTWATMMRMSGVWVEKQRSCFLKPIPFPSERKTTDVLGVCIMNLISVGFERLTNRALRWRHRQASPRPTQNAPQ